MMTRLLFGLLLLPALALPARAAGLELSIADGKVTLDAQDVTIRQILTEWARVGNTRIVNVERLEGGPVTIKFEGLPEKQALDIILRSVPGYVAAPRDAFAANVSMYETILVMPTTTAVAAVRPQAPAFGGMSGPAASITQLRQPAPVMPSPSVDTAEPPDPQDDPALAAAAAAGLVPVSPPGANPSVISAPLAMPGGVPPSATPAVATPANPWNAPVGTAQPSLAPPPPPPVATQPVLRPRPPQADR
jgi:hypothetical protein